MLLPDIVPDKLMEKGINGDAQGGCPIIHQPERRLNRASRALTSKAYATQALQFDLARTLDVKSVVDFIQHQPGNPSLVVSEREFTLYQWKEIEMALRLGDIAPDFTSGYDRGSD